MSVAVAALMISAITSVVASSPARAAVPDDEVYVPVAGSPLSSISTAPASLSPAFSADIHDYVMRCHTGVNAIALTLSAAGGSIQAGYQSGATVSLSVNLGESQAAIVQAPDARNPTGPSAQFWIRCLPHDFPALSVTTGQTPVPAGWYLTGNITPSATSSTYAMILDQNGTPVWYQAAPGGAIDVEALPNHTIAWSPSQGPGIGANPTGAFYTYQLDTQTAGSQAAPIPPTDPHEMLPMANGNLMMIATPLLATSDLGSVLGPQYNGVSNIVDCLLEEVDPTKPTAPVWTWRMSAHVNVAEANTTPMLATAPTNVNGQMAADIYHCNSVEIEPGTGDILVSSRNTNAVYLIDGTRPGNNNIKWKLGGTSSNHDNAQILVPDTSFSGQHDARFQPNGAVSLYDDHTLLKGPARGIEYAININISKATTTWEYDSSGDSSIATGSFRRYSTNVTPCPAGNPAACNDNLIGWGFKPGSGFTEVDANHNLLMNLTYPNGEREYRVMKVPPSAFDIKVLRETAGIPRPVTTQVSLQPLGGILTSKPAAAAWAPNRFDVFVRGTDNQMWHKWRDGTQWFGWEPLGGVLTSGPAVAAWSANRLDVFVRGTDNQMWHRWWDGTQWFGWEPLGGVLTSGPAVASWGNGRLDVVVQGTDRQMWHRWWDGVQWNGWEPLGGQSDGDAAASSWGLGRLDIFIRNPDSTLGHRWYDGGQWSGWEWFAASLPAGPSATSASPGEVDVAGTGPGSVLGHFEYNGSWQYMQSLGAPTAQPPAVVAVDPTHEDVLTTGTDGGLWIGTLSTAPQTGSSQKASVSPRPSPADAARL